MEFGDRLTVRRGIICALRVHLGANDGEYPFRREVVELDDVVDGGERRQQLHALGRRQKGSAGPLETAHRFVAVDPDDENVAERTRPLEAPQMTDVHQIEAAVRPYHGLALRPPARAKLEQLLER